MALNPYIKRERYKENLESYLRRDLILTVKQFGASKRISCRFFIICE